MTTPAPLPVGTRVEVVPHEPTGQMLSPAERSRLSKGEPVTGTICDNDSFESHDGYAVHLDVPGSTLPHRVFLPAAYLGVLVEDQRGRAGQA